MLAKSALFSNVVHAQGEEPLFSAGDAVRVLVRYPIGHYRVPSYVRGKRGVVESVVEPRAVNNEEEGYGRNAALTSKVPRKRSP